MYFFIKSYIPLFIFLLLHLFIFLFLQVWSNSWYWGSFCFTGSFLVEAGESVPDDILRVGSIEPFSKHSEEHGEVDGPRSFTHHPIQVIFRRVLTWAQVPHTHQREGQYLIQKTIMTSVPLRQTHPKRPACHGDPLYRWIRLGSGRSCWRPPWTPGSVTGQTWQTHLKWLSVASS